MIENINGINVSSIGINGTLALILNNIRSYIDAGEFDKETFRVFNFGVIGDGHNDILARLTAGKCQGTAGDRIIFTAGCRIVDRCKIDINCIERIKRRLYVYREGKLAGILIHRADVGNRHVIEQTKSRRDIFVT